MSDVQSRPFVTSASVFMICITIMVIAAAVAFTLWKPFEPWTKEGITKEGATTVQELKRASQLIVLRGKVKVFKHLTSEKSIWIVNLGATEIALHVPDNGFQYIVKLDGLKDNAFEHDVSRKRWILRVPKPVLDTEMIACETDPAKMDIMTKTGWARLDSASGKSVYDAALREIKAGVIEQAQQAWIQETAKDAARSALDAFISKLIRKLPEDEALSIEFIDDTLKDKPVSR